MIKNFDFAKRQLRELASVLNEFKSEAVQLRVVELLLQRMGTESEEDRQEDRPEKRKKEIKRKVKPKVKQRETRPKIVSKGGRPGPSAIVNQLIEEGFFKTPKVVGDIVAHFRSKGDYGYKRGGLDTGLLRAARSKALQRRKNAEGQFEYYE